MAALRGRSAVVLAVTLLAAGIAATAALLDPPTRSGASPTPSPHNLTASTAPDATANASAPDATPGASAGLPAAASGIVPGRIDRTSIDLVATYDVDVQLGFDDRSLVVDETIAVANRSGDGIDRIELNTITAKLGNLRLAGVQVDGNAVEPRVDGQSIVVPLGGVLPDGAGTTLRIRLRATLRSTLDGSSWMFTRKGGILQASRWLPWIGLQRSFDRPNIGDPFYTALSPHVRVRITSDRRLVIATPGARVAIDGRTQTFEADNVRDFHIVASPSFTIRERRVGDWTLRAYVRAGFPAAAVLDDAADGLTRMNALAGAYPYPTFTIAQTAGGYALEGPGMIWIPTGLSGSRLHWNIYHETAHQWFYGLVGSDGALDPFADEAVATHLGQVVSGIWRSNGCPWRRLDLSIYRYSTSCYFGQIYLHGAELLRSVRRAMGSAAFWEATREYVAAHRFAIGSTAQLLQTLQAHTSKDLRPILAPWFPSIYN
jgi:hypothetical protein